LTSFGTGRIFGIGPWDQTQFQAEQFKLQGLWAGEVLKPPKSRNLLGGGNYRSRAEEVEMLNNSRAFRPNIFLSYICDIFSESGSLYLFRGNSDIDSCACNPWGGRDMLTFSESILSKLTLGLSGSNGYYF